MVLSIEPLPPQEREIFLRDHPEWRYERSAFVREVRFSSYGEGVEFACRVARLAEKACHHPEITIGFKTVTVRWWTHKIGDVSRGDRIMATKVEEILRETTKTA